VLVLQTPVGSDIEFKINMDSARFVYFSLSLQAHLANVPVRTFVVHSHSTPETKLIMEIMEQPIMEITMELIMMNMLITQ